MDFPPLFAFVLPFYWELIPVVLISCGLMVGFTFWLFSNRYAGRYVCLAWIGFLSVLAIGYWRIVVEENGYRSAGTEALLGVTQTFASTTEQLGHASVTDRVSQDDPAVQSIRKMFKAWCRDIPFISGIYTLRTRQNEKEKLDRVVFWPEENHSRTELPEQRFRPLYAKVFSGQAVLDFESPDEAAAAGGSRRHVITAVAPLKDAHGSIEAILCVDFQADDLKKMFASARSKETKWSTLLLTLYLLAIGAGGLLHRSFQRLKSANEDLVAARKTADVASKAKSDFLANMSHEIRTPMNALLGFTDILTQRMEQNCSPAEREESQGILEIIRKSSQDLLTIITDILDFSRIEANLLQIESVPLSIKQVIEDVWQMEQADVIAKNLDFAVRYKEPIPELILGDPVRLRQIMTNLISNAIKFTDKGSITIHCETVDSSEDDPMRSRSGRSSTDAASSRFPSSVLLRIDVIDTGIGIDEEQFGKLFRPFTQVDTSSTRQFGGTGLGLSIAKRLAQLMDGDISVVSTPHSGSTFTLQLHAYLPSKKQSSIILDQAKKRGTEEPPGSGVRHSSKMLKLSPSDIVSETIPKQESESPPQNLRPLRNARILLVEDMLVNQVVIETQLRDAGAKVEIVGNGQLGVDKINQDVDDGLFFDVVLMDMQMPVMDGYEATMLLRSQGYTRPIIAITAHALTGDREKTIAAGCDDYIAKPVDRRKLIEMIKKYLKPGAKD